MANNALPAAVDDRHGLYERDYYTWAVEQPTHLRSIGPRRSIGKTSRKRSRAWAEANGANSEAV